MPRSGRWNEAKRFFTCSWTDTDRGEGDLHLFCRVIMCLLNTSLQFAKSIGSSYAVQVHDLNCSAQTQAISIAFTSTFALNTRLILFWYLNFRFLSYFPLFSGMSCLWQGVSGASSAFKAPWRYIEWGALVNTFLSRAYCSRSRTGTLVDQDLKSHKLKSLKRKLMYR